MSNFTIRHIIVLPKEVSNSDFSIFQGFSNEIINEYREILNKIIECPYHIFEFFIKNEKLIKFKAENNLLEVIMIREDVLKSKLIYLDKFLNIVWSTNKTFLSTKIIINEFQLKPIHISSIKEESIIHIQDVNYKLLAKSLLERVKKMRELADNEELINIIDFLLNNDVVDNDIEIVEANISKRQCVHSLVHTLKSCGFLIEKMNELVPTEDISKQKKDIIFLTNFIDKLISKYKIDKLKIKNHAILYCPSIYSHYYNVNNIVWKKLNKELDNFNRNVIRLGIIRNKGYGNFVIKSNNNKKDFNHDDGSKYLSFYLIHERQKELQIFTSIVSIIAASQFCPSIRFPNSVMLHHDILNNIAKLIISPNVNSLKALNKRFSAYSDAIKNDLGDDFIESIFSNRNKLFCICDFPIEWININGIPVMFTHEISRICSTPGNLTAQMGLRGEIFHIPCRALYDILIIRSFGEKDPLKNHLKIGLDKFYELGSLKNLNIQFVDINSKDELVETLNSFFGSIVIFDCHGNHGGVDDHGWLKIGHEKVDVWDLSGYCRIPPIVILSACSTHPIDGSHASVANGFFKCGALSVIGTYAPVRADHSAILVCRILLRISEYIPVVTKYRNISWREVISGFFKMSYATDILMGFLYKLNIVSVGQYKDARLKLNIEINSGNELWYDELIKILEIYCSLNNQQVKSIIKNNFQFVETMLYTQLGRPENIIICNDKIFNDTTEVLIDTI